VHHPLVRFALAMAETLAALAGAFALTILLSIPALATDPLALQELLRSGTLDPALLDTGTWALLMTAQALAFLAVAGLLVWLRVRPDVGAPSFRPGWAVIPWGVGAGVAAWGVSWLLSLALDALGQPVEEQAWLRELLRSPHTVALLSPWLVLVVPFSEEAFFRGYMFRFLERRVGLAAAVLVSATAFGAVHLNASGFVVYVAIGVVLALVYRRTGSLIAPVLAHMTHNGATLIQALLLGPGS